jgi:hypothetical protein
MSVTPAFGIDPSAALVMLRSENEQLAMELSATKVRLDVLWRATRDALRTLDVQPCLTPDDPDHDEACACEVERRLRAALEAGR